MGATGLSRQTGPGPLLPSSRHCSPPPPMLGGGGRNGEHTLELGSPQTLPLSLGDLGKLFKVEDSPTEVALFVKWE